MLEQLDTLVQNSNLTLGVPIESRVKSWESIAEKLERKNVSPARLEDIEDLLGLRVIFLFQRDLEEFHGAIERTFQLISSEDTAGRLDETQFGYKSRHYIVSLPADWGAIPSLNGLTGRKMEVQVRTLAQHIWAVASHKLQYKNEQSVPVPIRRSIHRVSALLETVDLEFSRVLTEREEYVNLQAAQASDQDSLDVTVIETVLNKMLPPENRDEDGEDYSILLRDLLHFGIDSRGSLIDLLRLNDAAMKSADRNEVGRRRKEDYDEDDDDSERRRNRVARGVFFTHVGLVRQAMREQFGDEAVTGWIVSNMGR
ncbi:ppGpp synthetase/RelA/SpoT-type nucleotidyltransferase [Xanthomonas arboricola]|uniref:GTP pyrophosphokinase n=1 Tax=Xanthomonas arboricola TaxID=56448 RepID=UPI001622362D|nr:hypothetical protein [Xanthomonas arboricola]MBB4605709.1 ppGpp synthetase/RelA/SpoT-type nucleotidyltransferase [Xanthomonas arboricola]